MGDHQLAARLEQTLRPLFERNFAGRGEIGASVSVSNPPTHPPSCKQVQFVTDLLKRLRPG